jgi:peptidyl-prolyl cis-trans isomerase A (cyclophilin A)
MASKKKHIRDARFRDRSPTPEPHAPPSTPKPTPSRAPEAARPGRPPSRAPGRSPAPPPVPSTPAAPAAWWQSANVLVPGALALAFAGLLAWMVRDNRPTPAVDAGVYAPDPTPADAATADGGSAPAAAPTPTPPPPTPSAPAEGAADAATADGGPLNGDLLRAVVPEPTSPDPRGGRFTLAQATAGLPAGGDLVAEIDTTMGTFTCTLLTGEAPNTVANFVGLARGLRDFWDPIAGRWTRRPFYNGSIFHRVIPDFMIQGGDQLRSGAGGTGYEFADENVRGHNAAGQLCMANRGPNTNGAQFFITEGPTSQLDGSYSIFGRCTPADLVGRIARVPTNNDRPLQPVFIRAVRVRRG